MIQIIFRTCDKVGSLNGLPRPFNLTKPEVIRGCFRSLLRALPKNKPIQIHLVADDLSSETIGFFDDELEHHSLKENTLVYHDKYGAENSLRKCFELAMQADDEDIVYLVEDDYLHIPNSLQPMIKFAETYACFVHPTDYPDRYTRTEDRFRRWLIFPGEGVHFREIANSTFTFLGKAKLFKEHSSVMFMSCKNSDDGFLSSMVFGKTPLFSPIPGLATHMHENVMSPFTDWQAIWNEVNI